MDDRITSWWEQLLGEDRQFVLALLLAGALAAGLLVTPLIARAKGPLSRTTKFLRAATRRGIWGSIPRRLIEVMGWIRRHAGSDEWKYAVPWVVLIGERGAGKTSIVASITSGRRARDQISPKERGLEGPDADWGFFDQGILVDVQTPVDSSVDEAVQRVAAQLDGHRPERGLDGLVLAISAPSLLGQPAESGGERSVPTGAELSGSGDRLYRQLVALQRRFEFTFPIHIVVTRCDRVEGFGAFWKRQPPERRAEIWGWSNPHSLDIAYAPAWIEEAFLRVKASMRTLQLDAAARNQSAEDADEFFLFPQRFAQLKTPLESVLNRVFQADAYHADFFLRGIYFAGSAEADGSANEPEPRSDVAFVDELFNEKVFSETRLARALRQGIWSRDKWTRRLQVAAVLAAVALFLSLPFAITDLNRRTENGVVSIRQIRAAAEQLRAATAGECVRRKSIYDLFQAVSTIDFGFSSLLIPASWPWVSSTLQAFGIASGLDEKADRIHQSAFRDAIFPSLRCRLERQARELVAGRPGDATGGPPAETVAAYQQGLIGYVAEVAAFEQNLSRFADLSEAKPAEQGPALREELAVLSQSLYGEPLPPVVLEPHGNVLRALALVQYQDKPALPPAVRHRVKARMKYLAQDLRNHLHGQLQRGPQLLDAIDSTAAQQPRSARKLAWWLEWLETSWLGASEQSNPCTKIKEQLAAALETLSDQYRPDLSVVLPGVQPGGLTTLFSPGNCYRPATEILTDTVIVTDPDTGLRFTDAFAKEVPRLKAVANLDFMQVAVTDRYRCRAPLQGWQGSLLTQAARSIDEYQRFASSAGLDPIATNTGERPLSDRLARRQLNAVLDQWLHRAQLEAGLVDAQAPASLDALSGPDRELERKSRAFGAVVDQLVLVLRMYQQLGFAESRAAIAACARQFAHRVIKSTSNLASMSDLYAPKVAPGAPDGSGTVALFSLGDRPETEDYLRHQLERAQVLVRYATPFVTFLMNTDPTNDAQVTSTGSAAYWENTIKEVNRFVQFKEPNGQVARLHDLLLVQLRGMTSADCGTRLATYQAPAAGHDLFSTRRTKLEQVSVQRCGGRTSQAASAAYDELAGEFNRLFAGRYPFGTGEDEASAIATQRFFHRYSAQRETLQRQLSGIEGYVASDARRFLDELDAVATFFQGTLLAGAGGQPIQVNVGFRAFPKSSPGSDQVIKWVLDSGNETASYPNGATEVSWEFGQDLTLELAWADRSKVAPDRDIDQADLSVKGPIATFSARGEWALLRLIGNHPRELLRPQLTEPGTKVLEFRVPTVTKGGASAEPQVARMYLTLALSATDPKTKAVTPLIVPAAFPTRAPRLWGAGADNEKAGVANAASN